MRSRRLRIIVLFAAAAPRLADAQQPRDSTSLRPIVITATRVPVERRLAPASVTVLAGAELRARGTVSAADALAAVPGLTVVRSGSFGATTSLFARGGNSNYVKVLVDGVPVNDPGGAVDLATLTTDNIERIEIVRGPVSVLYGSDAVSGVVQLFTRRGDGPARAFADVRGGSYGTVEGSAGLEGDARGLAYSLAAADRRTDGALAFNNDYWNRVGSGRLSLTPAGSTIDFTARRTDAAYHFPTDGAGRVVDSNAVRRDHRTSLGLDVSSSLTPRATLRVFGAASRLDGGSSNRPDSPGDSAGFYGRDDSRVDRRSVDVRADLRPSDGTVLSVGVAAEREQVRSASESQFMRAPVTTATFAAHRTNEALYAQLIASTRARMTYTVSGRLDDNGTFGTFVTGRASAAWQATPGTSLRAAVGNAFKAPAFDETFSSTFTIGNPDLEPERTVGWEASVEHRLGRHAALTATYFDQRFRDLIQYVFGDETTDFRGTNANLGAAFARGWEVEARAPMLGAFDAGANFTALETRVTDAGTGAFGTFVAGERLLRRPKRSATLEAGYRLTGASRVDATVRYVGVRDDRDFEAERRVTLPAYALLDLSASIALAPVSRALAPVTLTARLENALDRDYQTTFGFTAPGRTLLLGARAAIGGASR